MSAVEEMLVKSPRIGALLPRRLAKIWVGLSLVRRFSIAGGVVLLAGSLIIGSWVARKIESGVTQNTAVATALYMESFVAPVAQALVSADRLPPAAARRLDRVFRNTPLGERVVSYKLWKAGGLIAHAANPEIIGRRFPMTDGLRRALAGEVVADFDSLGDAEDAAERARKVALLEIYSPIRETYTGKVIAVAEFYERADQLQADLTSARRESWVVVGLVMLATSFMLLGIVVGGGRTISLQRRSLEQRVVALGDLAEQNRRLRLRVESAAGRATETNERFLRRLSADLHDGPTQMLALAALRLDRIEDETNVEKQRTTLGAVREAVSSALQEIHQLCRGLAAPELENLSMAAVIQLAIEGHRIRTSSTVNTVVAMPALQLPSSHRICAYRFVQEGLSNAYRHARGADQSVSAYCEGRRLSVSVTDAGPGFRPEKAVKTGGGLGIVGLRHRVESLGGTLTIETAPGAGTCLKMELQIEKVLRDG